jgi:hypothetical protein
MSVHSASLPTEGTLMSYCAVFFVMFGSSLPTEGTLMSYCTVLCDVWFLFTYRRNAHVLLPFVGKEEPNITKHSTIRHERSFCR